MLLGGYAIFGATGVLALHRKEAQVRQVELQRERLAAQNRQLQASVRALKDDPETIEAIARSQLHLTRPGEVVYTFTSPSTDTAMASASGHSRASAR